MIIFPFKFYTLFCCIHIYICRHMFFATRSPGTVLRADMDGENAITIVEGLEWPSGLDIDIPGKQIARVTKADLSLARIVF